MDGYGRVFVSKDWNIFKDRASHAGPSEWKGNKNISNTFAGIEVCSWGKVSTQDGSLARAMKDDPNSLRIMTSRDNIKSGYYQIFTFSQEMRLIQLCLIYNHEIEEFDFNNVVGHDEIAPDRKSDPGGSLSVSMPEFREILFYINKECPLHKYQKL